MDQARFWMPSKRKSDFIHPNILAQAAPMMNSTPYGDSWEEQAFAEDTAGGELGGCVWPPRSYSCTFCRREFRSAQALGGHMNVHRRDRARLKQQSPIPDDHHQPLINHLQKNDPSTYSSQMCSFLYTNPNTSKPSDPWNSPTSNVIRVSSSSPGRDSRSEERMSGLCFFSPLVQKISRQRQSSWMTIKDEEENKISIGTAPASRVRKEDCDSVEDLSTCLCLVTSHLHTQANASLEEEVGSFKRRRIHEAKPLFLPKSSLVDRCLPQSEVFSGLSEEGLDLELKLGDGPKVK